jgi:hypothetical protein
LAVQWADAVLTRNWPQKRLGVQLAPEHINSYEAEGAVVALAVDADVGAQHEAVVDVEGEALCRALDRVLACDPAANLGHANGAPEVEDRRGLVAQPREEYVEQGAADRDAAGDRFGIPNRQAGKGSATSVTEEPFDRVD